MTPLDRGWLRKHPLAQPEADTDKNERGRIVVVGGSLMVPGALRLTGEAALRAGAGKLQLGTIAEAATMLGMWMPEAGVFGLPADATGELMASAAPDVIEQAKSCDAIVLGPGMKGSEDCSNLIRSIVQALPSDVAILLDAAAIAACRGYEDTIRSHEGAVVITPHHGEMAALTGLGVDDIKRRPDAVAREVSAELNAIVVLKGATTTIAARGENGLFFDDGSPGLATGGSGDVLAGVLGGLMARGIDPLTASAWAVWAHAAAGQALSDRFGGLGLLSRELLDILPNMLNDAI